MTAPVARKAARVLLIDPDDRLLLVRFHSTDDGVPFWCPVGGGLDPGETAAEGAVREVFEETGLRDVEVGSECYRREVVFTWHGTTYAQSERWFVAHVGRVALDSSGWTDDERRDITALRWFTADELRTWDEALVPLDLAAVYASLLADGPPEAPIHLGF